MNQQKLKEHKTSKSEIAQLFQIVERDLTDAKIEELSNDRRFMTAYNAALQLTTIVMRIYGYRTSQSKVGHHRITIDALPEILGKKFNEVASYLNACRYKRNICDYTNSSQVSDSEVMEIIKETQQLKKDVVEWIESHYSQFLN